jgi:hypothetical protein
MNIEKEAQGVKVKPRNYSPIKEEAVAEEVGEDNGSHAKVFDLKIRIDGKEYVMKEAEYKNYRPPLTKFLRINLSRRTVDRFATWLFGTKNVEVYPTPESAKRAYKEEYKLIKKYLSPVDNDRKLEDDPRQELSGDFKNPQSKFLYEMQELLGNKESTHKLGEIFERHRNDNLLKDEQLVIGLPRDLSREKVDALRKQGKRIPSTYYIFQEKVTGDVVSLSRIRDKDLAERPLVLEKLITLALLQRKMFKDTGKMMDLRPDEFLKYPQEWFQKTDNILIDRNTDNVFCIDTRWLWDNEARIMGGKWFNLIDNLCRKSIDRAIKKYFLLLSSAQ